MNDQGFDYNNYIPPQDPSNEQPPFVAYNAPEHSNGIDFKAIFRSGLFLALCIMVTIMFAVNTLSSGIDIICLLIMIGLWLCYSAGRDEIGKFNPRGLKLISGSLLANVIIQWVTVGLTFISGLLSLLVGVLIPKSSYAGLNREMANALAPGGEFYAMLYELEGIEEIEQVLGTNWQNKLLELDWEAFFPVMLVAIGIFCFVAGLAIALATLLIYHQMHAFAKSLHVCVQKPDATPKYVRWVSAALIVMTVFNGISIFSIGTDLMVGLQSALLCAIYILTYVFIKKNFSTPDTTTNE